MDIEEQLDATIAKLEMELEQLKNNAASAFMCHCCWRYTAARGGEGG